MRVLFIADVIGSPGRAALKVLPSLLRELKADFSIANGENAAGGFGLTKPIADEFFALGIDVITSGNHLWDRKEARELVAEEARVLRPANYPPGVPGLGGGVFRAGDMKVAVINLLGRVFIKEVDCPFRCADGLIEELRSYTPIIVVDVHAEATSEKMALAWYLDGRVSAVVGTHTHVQTADERILPQGTGFITDAGMTGPFDSVIGIEKEGAIRRFLSQTPVRLTPAKDDVRLNGVILDIDSVSGKCKHLERLSMCVASNEEK